MSTETKEINLHVAEGQDEVIIRHGAAAEKIPFRKSLEISGNIDLPRLHLQNPPDWLVYYPEKCIDAPLSFSFVMVDREAMLITFTEDQGMPWESRYRGDLRLDPRFAKFGVNSDKYYTTLELADFIKMNRSFFETKDSAMRLVKELRSFKAKVDKDIENSDDGRGNKKLLLAQKLDSNIPEAFNLTIPIFKGGGKQTIAIEISINTDFTCTLISPEVADYIEETRDMIMDSEIHEIKELFPQLRIFEV